MKLEDKDLLLADLCARLPYGVKIHIGKTKVIEVFNEINLRIGAINSTYADIKPYLFPLTEEILDKATEESINLYKELICIDSDLYIENNESNILLLQAKIRSSVIKYFNIHHIDYNGLIEKGLAIDATNLNIY